MAMKCHYEVLGVALDSTTKDITKAYRKLALRWHPDKNPESAEAARKEFLLVHQAYQVLVDPQERAWYDKHRGSILREEGYKGTGLDLFAYFRASCYKGYGDDSRDFYAVYANVFKLIFEEEVEFLEQTHEMEIAPEFGNSKSSYDEVVKVFYGYWEGYCTAKSFEWVEGYDTRDAGHRMVRRQMEQENKKLRNKARKDWNEKVRALVAFVKKRDPRVMEHNRMMQEKASERNRLAEERRNDEKKKRIESMQRYKESEWSSLLAMSNELERLEKAIAAEFSEESDDSEDDLPASGGGDDDAAEEQTDKVLDLNELDVLHCIACDKSFKSLNTMENHKKSKKHLTNAANLIEQMKSENAELIGDLELELNPSENAQTQSKKSKKNKKKISEDTMESPPSELTEISQAEENNTDLMNNEVTVKEVEKASKKTKSTKMKNPSTDLSCNVCNSTFATRNKLFDHIKAEGHALRVDAPKVSKKERTRNPRSNNL